MLQILTVPGPQVPDWDHKDKGWYGTAAGIYHLRRLGAVASDTLTGSPRALP